MITLAEAIADAKQRLANVGDSPRQDAEILLAQLLGLSRAQLFARLRDPLSTETARAFAKRVERRAKGVPVAYLTGEREFWTLTLKVTPDVLVPRPETETLVEWTLEIVAASFPERREAAPGIADLGTGSGAIALALASELPRARIVATDFSAPALAVARENAAALDLARVRFVETDFASFLAAAGASFDFIVSNPPYVSAQDEHLGALHAEPLIALTDGGDGLNALRCIVTGAPARLASGGWLLVEHGYDQGEAVRALFRAAGFARIETRRDLGGQERATAGQWRASA